MFMAVHAAVGFLFTGSSLAARGWRDSPLVSAVRLPALVGVASLTATIMVWHALADHDRQRTFQLIESQAARLRAAIAGPLDAQARAIERMAARLSVADTAPDVWVAEARQHLADFGAAQAIERIDPGSGRLWAVPEHRPVGPGLKDARERVIGEVIRMRSTAVSDTVSLAGAADGFLIAVPIVRADQAFGALVGVIGFNRLIESALAEQDLSGYELSLFHGVRKVYGPDHPGPETGVWVTDVDRVPAGTLMRAVPPPKQRTT